MEYLPVNLILKILEYVPIQNRLKLRTISKQFKEIIDYKIPEQLILYSEDAVVNYGFELTYGSTKCDFIKYDKYLTDNNLLIIKDEDFFSSVYLFKFKKIKKLKSVLNYEFLISADYFFNLFEELTELYILNYDSYSIGINLKLKKLKKLVSNIYFDHKNRLKLDTPSLIELKIEDFRNVYFIYPDKLLKLTIYLNDNTFDLTKLYKFKNLEQLKIKNNDFYFIILNRKLLKRLINLKKFIIIDNLLNSSTDRNKMNLINNFNYSRKNLEIIINGLEINQLKNANAGDLFDFWIKSIINSSKINKIKLRDINYSMLMELFNYELPTNFHTKITRIDHVSVGIRIGDESKLADFIKRSNAKNLYLITELSNSFYRQLNNENLPITHLFATERSELNFSDKETNDFIFNPKIRYLKIHSNSLQSEFKFFVESLSNYNLQNSNKLIIFRDNHCQKSIEFSIYDSFFYINVSYTQNIHRDLLDDSEIELDKIEFSKFLNLMKKQSDDEYSYFGLTFLIDRINLINSSYTIMMQKLFEQYDISEQIFKSNSI